MRLILLIVVLLLALALALLLIPNWISPKLGVSEGRLTPLGGRPNGVSTVSDDPAKRIDPWPLLPDAWTRIEAAARSYGGARVLARDDNYLRLTFTTPVMRWRDDVEFWRDPAGQQIEIRSESRAGYSDGGLNRRRLDALKQFYLGE